MRWETARYFCPCWLGRGCAWEGHYLECGEGKYVLYEVRGCMNIAQDLLPAIQAEITLANERMGWGGGGGSRDSGLKRRWST
jgi:hypothetical protein